MDFWGTSVSFISVWVAYDVCKRPLNGVLRGRSSTFTISLHVHNVALHSRYPQENGLYVRHIL